MVFRIAFITTFLATNLIFGQENPSAIQKKKLNTILSNENISIDGELKEPIWQKAAAATDFFMYRPDNGKPIDGLKKSDVKVVYDNEAIYIGAILNDDQPNKIMKEITKRDDDGASDFFGVSINGYNDGQQEFRFIVTAAGVQLDCNANDQTGEDYSWDAVWDSKIKITSTGWTVEIKIPYSALRFSKENVQTWGINFLRQIQRDRQLYTWTNIDNKIRAFAKQSGELHGIENIKTPTRLFLLPYASYYVNADASQKTKGIAKGGLDIKYGINSAFTLDMILIPDFGQAALDQKILNLSPFEQQFNENRSFFTEGTDLFSKANLLYSRRIGGKPTYELADNESYAENPSNVSLLNAFKISGRTKNGLGIGVLNAVTEKTFGNILNLNTNQINNKIIEPLANYNVLVFDQRFRKNSSISFINTNATRDGHFRDGNVSALVWDLNTKANTYNLQGNYKFSIVNDNLQYKYGSNANLEISKTSGKYRYGMGGNILTKNYNNNDLGINFETNYYSFYQNASYRILNPSKHFNNFGVFTNVFHQFQIETGKPQTSNININTFASNKKNNSYGINIFTNPIKTYNYYEARVNGRVFVEPEKVGFGGFYSSNYNKKFAYDFDTRFSWANQTARNNINFSVSPRYRFNDKLSLIYQFNFNRGKNNKGTVTKIDTDANNLTPPDIIVANRDLITYSNTLTGKYSLSNTMNFNIALNHYWSYSENKNFLLLEQDGSLSNYTQIVPNLNQDFSNWNLDMNYSWWFAPGSQVSLLYRNNASHFSRNIDKDFGKNFTNLLNNDVLQHTLSISIKYFIDYNNLKSWF